MSHQGAEHGPDRLAPARRILTELFEVLLQGEVCVLTAESCGHQLADAFDDGQIRARELIAFRDVGIESPCHGTRRGGLTVDGEFCHHRHTRRQLPVAAERHKHRGRADGAVETFGKPLVRADILVDDQRMHPLSEALTLPAATVVLGFGHMHIGVLRSAVRGEEGTADINDRVALPGHAQTLLLGHTRHHGGLKVLLTGIFHELIDVFGCQGHRHALLAFGDRELGPVQTLVLPGNGIKIDVEPISQLAGCHGDAAGPEIVAALDQTACIATTEQPLQLALDGCVALLDLGTAILKAFGVL